MMLELAFAVVAFVVFVIGGLGLFVLLSVMGAGMRRRGD